MRPPGARLSVPAVARLARARNAGVSPTLLLSLLPASVTSHTRPGCGPPSLHVWYSRPRLCNSPRGFALFAVPFTCFSGTIPKIGSKRHGSRPQHHKPMGAGMRSKRQSEESSRANIGAATGAMRSMPAAEAFSFLRETRGLTTWTVRDMANSLNISPNDAEHVAAILQLQGYVKPAGMNEWMTTLSGEDVSKSKPPRFTPERVEEAISELRRRIIAGSRESRSRYQITKAVAFGEFLSGRARVQAVEVGIQLSRKRSDGADGNLAEERKAQKAFLKSLKPKGGVVRISLYEKWMSERTHLNLLNPPAQRYH